jgi:hypothetical protein
VTDRPRPLVELRIRSRVSDEEMAEKVGKILTPEDFNLLPTRDVKLLKPDGQVLLIYRRGIIPQALRDATWPILHELKSETTTNRGLASGTPRIDGPGKRSYAKAVPSALLGAFEAQGPKQFCRLTAWTGTETENYRLLWPLLEFIGGRMAADAPDRYQAQMAEVSRTHPDWLIPGTPFSTVTVNNTYPTGVHKDAGDLDSGISTLAVLRKGSYAGAHLVFPEYRVAVDMQDGDLLLMDAHSWHGNTDFDPPVKRSFTGRLEEDPGFERISVVAYYRTKLTGCKSAEDEAERRQILAEQRASARVGE